MQTLALLTSTPTAQLNQSTDWLMSADRAAYKQETWQFLEGGKSYQLEVIRNGYGGVSINCSCSNPRCRHFQAIKQADAERVAQENLDRKGGAIAQPDGTVKIDHGFYRTMGSIRQHSQ